MSRFEEIYAFRSDCVSIEWNTKRQQCKGKGVRAMDYDV